MRIAAIIPARYASTRLPGKPLLNETGKPLIQHVVEAVACVDCLDEVVVATDDERIRAAVEGFGRRAVMTRDDHACGTDRIAEAAGILGLGHDDLVVNVQGDEPDIAPASLVALIEMMQRTGSPMGTLATPLPVEQAFQPARVKVVLSLDSHALYFSRSPIPHDREGAGDVRYLLHLGVYAYRAGFLKTFAALEPTPAERHEKLEQLRALEHGYRIAVAVVQQAGTGIDTRDDYAAFVGRVCSGEADTSVD
jgi:3-deoxy-manno-octulosonate cytidylyltransferase (CMP-KDO synthetase)